VTRRDLGRLVAGVLTASGEGNASPPIHVPVDCWRQHFPTLEGSALGTRLVYLDSAATTQRPTVVLDAMMEFYRRGNANPGKAQHALARHAYEEYENARGTVARFLNAAGPEEIVWTRGTTEAINLG
jgi:selenocysteine lyase/cysteine desulfurase